MFCLWNGLWGILVFTLIGVFLSDNPKKINWKNQFKMFFLLMALAVFFIKVSWGVLLIEYIADFFSSLYMATEKGIEFLFGNLANPMGPWGFIFLFKVIPIIIFFSALIAGLRYMGFIQRAVSGLGKILTPLMGTQNAETLCAAANSFLGQTEAPILIKDYLPSMSDSELFAVMVSGMGTISGGLLAVYGCLGIPIKHLLISSILSIPATLFFAKLVMPYSGNNTKEAVRVSKEDVGINLLDALAKGTIDGLNLAMIIAAILLVTISLLGIINNVFSFLSYLIVFGYQYFTGTVLQGDILSLEKILAFVGYPAAWLIGVSKDFLQEAASLIGTKIAVNEMIAYSKLVALNIDPRNLIILTYALCGFSNFSSIGIQIGGIGALCPEKRGIISKLGIKAVFTAACANLLIASIISFLI